MARTIFFFLLAAYYVLRPVREQMGLAGGVRNLPWLYLGTLATTLIVNPAFATLVARFPRRVFLPVTYRACMAVLVGFWLLFRIVPDSATIHVARAFYVWVSVFNMFAVSVFWGFMADRWRRDQAKRLFGVIGLGGTLGAVAGSALTAGLAERFGPAALLLLSVAFLEVAVGFLRGVLRTTEPKCRNADPPGRAATGLGGGALEGFGRIARSPYLLAVCAYMFLFPLTSTVTYFLQANIVAAAVADPAARTALFAKIDLAVNLLTATIQAFLTGRVLRLLGVGGTLAVLPVVTAIGFTGLAWSPVLAFLVVFQTLRRATNYGLARPAREVLFTVVTPTERYKSKSLIDTFVYRGADAVGAWLFALVQGVVAGLAPIAGLAVPVAIVWLGVAGVLGRLHATRARAATTARDGDDPSTSPY